MKIQPLLFATTLLFLATTSFADDCSITVDSTDMMQFTTKAISVNKTCKEFTVTLTHSGKLPKQVMGHNWVLSKSADTQAIAKDAIAAGIANNYLKLGDTRVIAYTKIIGGGEKTSVTFPTSKLSPTEKYTFFCSFPGHISIMSGSLTLK
ncbi:MAG: azurin [Spongiibacteraceae bacterium]|nr:azurin [Spongiibacteraceae bacterium]